RAAPTQAFDVGVRLTDERSGATLAYIPTVGAIDDATRRVAAGADLLLFDGTFWSDDDLRAAGVEATTPRELGHRHVGGAAGELSRQELQLWVANRFYYQVNIPIKDALILSSCPEREVRQQWIQRIIDHDGRSGEEGGIEAWLRLGEAMGVNREDMVGQRFLLPGVRFAVDAYVSFCRFRPWLEAVAA